MSDKIYLVKAIEVGVSADDDAFNYYLSYNTVCKLKLLRGN